MKFNVFTTATRRVRSKPRFKFTNAWLLREGRLAKAVDAKDGPGPRASSEKVDPRS
jgi:hypothetical protein